MSKKKKILIGIMILIVVSIIGLVIFFAFSNKGEKEVGAENSSQYDSSYTMPYYIKVNHEAQVVSIYTQDENGYHTVPYKAMICSTGTKTPKKGVYRLPEKAEKPSRARWIALEGSVWGQYGTRITEGILFHSVPYDKQTASSLRWSDYDKLGEEASKGCIRLTVIDAKWIYENCMPGTKVEFYASSDPGPLGKPVAQKISDEFEILKRWDPTDPNEENPWHKVGE